MSDLASLFCVCVFKDFIYIFDSTIKGSGRGRSRLPAEQEARCGALREHEQGEEGQRGNADSPLNREPDM